MNLYLTELQAAHLRATIRERFDKWHNEKLAIRAKHLDGLLQATAWRQVEIRQAGIRALDQEIEHYRKCVNSILESISEMVERSGV